MREKVKEKETFMTERIPIQWNSRLIGNNHTAYRKTVNQFRKIDETRPRD